MLPLKLDWDKAQTQWKSQLDPVLSSPFNGMNILPNVALTTGANVVNHLLGRLPQGWIVLDNQGTATVYRSAPYTSTTLTLTASGATTITIGVF